MELRLVTPILFLLLASSCGLHYQKIYAYKEDLFSLRWEEVVEQNRIGEEENIKAVHLYEGEESSHFIVQIRFREKPHIHTEHDITVVLKKGEGMLRLGDREVTMKRGDIAVIRKGLKHYFVNSSKSPSIAYVVFSPRLKGKDIVMVEE